MKDEDRIVVALAALLHDIGKFEQRSMSKMKRHQILGSEFANTYLPNFGSNIKERVSRIISDHHNNKSDDILTKIVMKADALSASERLRVYEDTQEDGKDTTYYDVQRRLSSVFNPKYYYLIQPITLDPIPQPKADYASSVDEYKSAWDGFVHDVKLLESITMPYTYIESLLYIMKKHLLFIPSAPAYESVPTISLYEHLRLTMAIALSLYDYCFIDNNLDVNRLEHKKKLMLIYGDIGGIQRFIYTIAPKGAAKALRARSFFLNMVSDAIAKYIVNRLQLSSANIIFSAGGNFEILAPLTQCWQIEEIEKDIMKFLLSRFDGRLYITIAHTELEDNELDRTDRVEFTPAKRIGEIIEEKKRKPFFTNISIDYEKLFGPLERRSKVCHVCDSETDEDEDEEGVVKCTICKAIEGIAKPLASASYIVEISTSTNRNRLYEWDDERFYSRGLYLDRLGLCYVLIKDDNALKAVLRSISEDDRLTIYSINRLDAIDKMINAVREVNTNQDHNSNTNPKPIDCVLGYKLIANVTPLKNNDIKTFDEIAYESRGDKLVGVIRMDVDNLGRFFINTTTLSEYSTKSTLLSLFFDGYISTICKKYPDVYTIYSGGDDLFIIAPWDKTVDLAKEIREKFTYYTAGYDNPALTISAGLLFTDPRLPIHVFAEVSRQMLEKAKHNADKHYNEKNKINVFGYVVKWDIYNDLLDIYSKLKELVEEGKLSRSFITNMLHVWMTSKTNDESLGVLRYRLKYIVGKAVASTNNEDSKQSIIEYIDKKGIGSFINYLGLPLKLVELATRSGV
ncbi:CRISPR-associated protein Cas10/Csm1 [archaeon HR04]|nr:CRISPR-associated protein Cas10/Csm1 [archaeon HR04]